VKPKVLIVCPRLDIGGTERHLVRVLTALRGEPVDASLFVLARGGSLEGELVAAGVPLFGVPARASRLGRAAGAGLALYRHLRAERPDIVHFFLPEAYLVGSAAAAAAGIRIRVMSRRSLTVYQQDYPMLGRVESWLHRRTTALLGNSTAVVEQLAAEGAAPERIGLIYNGVTLRPLPDEAAPGELRAALGIDPQALVFAVVANLIAYKGHADLFDALALIRDRIARPWQLILIGRDEGIGEALRAQAERCGIGEHILWLGERDDADRLIEAADMSLVASHQEGFSNSLIEAMGAGLAVIATAVGGNKDAIAHGETGLLVAAHAPQELAAAILAMANDPDRMRRFGQAGRRRVETLFSLEACVKAYVNLYRGIVKADGRRVADIIAGQ
jgi:glycosyltransferase involved in cell wall biosynthesis